MEKSKTIVYPNGDILTAFKCRKALFNYWQLTAAEKRAFDRLCERSDLKELFIREKEKYADSDKKTAIDFAEFLNRTGLHIDDTFSDEDSDNLFNEYRATKED